MLPRIANLIVQVNIFKCNKLISFFLLSTIKAAALTQTTPPDQLRQYSSSAQWLHLLHMKKSIWGGYKSRIEKGSKYFLSPNGNTDPLTELLTTIEAFTNPAPYLSQGLGHPHCLFPARLKILKRDLGLKVVDVGCPNLEVWRQRLKADEIAIVYASQFISNPGSAMGHTLLKFITRNQEDYLNMGLGYAAQIDDSVGALKYLFLGLFGGFSGVFSIDPYYQKVFEYNNMEKRDIWEFKLKLGPESKALLVDHFWELVNNSQIDYFFLDENCAYIILTALQVVLPDEDFLSDFPVYVIPFETIKTLNRKGMVLESHFRPSIQTKLLSKYENLRPELQSAVLKSIKQGSAKNIEDALALETILDFTSLSRQENAGVLKLEYMSLEKEALLMRSKLGKFLPPEVPVPETPLNSHGPFQLEMGGGNSNQSSGFAMITINPGGHPFIDKDVGYLENSAFNLMRTTIKYDFQQKQFKLSNLVFGDFGVFIPYSSIDSNWSWRVRAEYTEDTGSLCSTCTYFNLNPMGGLSFKVNSFLNLHTLANLDWQGHHDFIRGQRVWPGLTIQGDLRIGSSLKVVQRENMSQELIENNGLRKFSSETSIRIFDVWPKFSFGADFQYFHYFGKLADFTQYQILTQITF